MDADKEQEKRNRDLEKLLGEPKAAIRSMVLAIFLALAVVEVNQFVDTYWVSGLGSVSSSAVSTVSPIYGLIMCAGIGVSTGVTAAVAFHLGRGESEFSSRIAANSLTLGLILAIISSVLVWIFAEPLLDLMGADDVIDECMEYLMPFIYLSPLLLCSNIMGGMLRGEGAANKSTVVQASAAILNMIIDPILIYGLDMGVAGAGYATCISAGISLVIGLWWYAKGKTVVALTRDSFRPDKAAMKRSLDVGGPKSVERIISNFTDLIQRVFLIAAGGTNAVMYYNYAWRYIALIDLPGRSFENAMVPVCSAGYGQKDLEKMKTGFMYTIKLVVIITVVLSAFVVVAAEPLMALLTYEESMAALRDDFVWTLRVSAFLIPFSALMGVGASMLQSMNKAKLAMNFYFIWGVAKLIMYAICAYCFGSYEGIIYSMVIIHVIGGALLMWMGFREFHRLEKEFEPGGPAAPPEPEPEAESA